MGILNKKLTYAEKHGYTVQYEGFNGSWLQKCCGDILTKGKVPDALTSKHGFIFQAGSIWNTGEPGVVLVKKMTSMTSILYSPFSRNFKLAWIREGKLVIIETFEDDMELPLGELIQLLINYYNDYFKK